MRRRLERWRLVVTVVVLCAATSSRGVRCESEQLCSAIEDARLCLASERTGARCKWCSPKERSQKGYCIDISAPSEICTDGDIFEFDDSLFRSAGVETHFEKSSLFITPTEIDDKLFVLGLPVPPALDNALTVEEDEFIPLFACNEYVLGEVTRTLEKILYKKRVSSARDEIHKEFPDVPTTDTESILRSIQKQTMNHLGRIAGSVLPAVGIPIGEAQINMVAPAISAFVHGVRVVTGVAKDFIAPVHGNTIVNLNKGGMVEGGRYFHFSDFWQAYKRLRGVLSRAGPLESILDEALRTIEVERTTSELHAANEHLLNKFAKTAVHSLLGLLSGGISVPLSVSADAAASFVIEEKHNRNVASRSVLMVYILYLRELLCAEHLAQPSSSISTDSDSTTLPQEVQPGTNPPVLPSSEASTQRALRLGDFWAPALKRVKPCDIREPNPCPFGFYCHRDTLFRVNDDRNPIGYCTPATARQRELGEPCTVDSDCFSGICAPPPQPSESTRSSKPVCLSASYVDLGNCKEIRASKIVRADEGTTFEEFTTEEVEYVKERYKHALQAVASRKEAFDKVKKQLKAHRLNDPEAPYYKERERLDSWLVYFQHLSDKPPSSDSILPSCDPWLQPFLDLVKRDVEGTESRVAAQVQEHVTSSRRRRHVPFDLTRLSSNQAEAAPDQRQGSTSEHAATRRVSKVAPVISSWMLLLQEAETAYSRLDAAERELSAAEEELRQILYYQCGEERSGSTRSSALTRPKIMEWRGDIQFPVIAENDALESIFQEYDTHLKDPDVLGVHKLILINHLLGHILSAGRLEPDSPVIHWMLTICLYGDPELAMHGMYDKIQIRVAEAIAKVIPCEKIFRDWLHHAGILLLHVEDPVVNCPVIALEHLIASGCVFR
eukprot:GILJ01003358.1.p1 GENE.GILJ01003358.1~~GILJ01003358.1.p1  ORF type:complete len:895 (+),score=62.74 GILJ01003358.1:53-2737(+)